jgi:hypothetical protein
MQKKTVLLTFFYLVRDIMITLISGNFSLSLIPRLSYLLDFWILQIFEFFWTIPNFHFSLILYLFFGFCIGSKSRLHLRHLVWIGKCCLKYCIFFFESNDQMFGFIMRCVFLK